MTDNPSGQRLKHLEATLPKSGLIEMIHTDVVWNAAIEAAAYELEQAHGLEPEAVEFWAKRIRELKRFEYLEPNVPPAGYKPDSRDYL